MKKDVSKEKDVSKKKDVFKKVVFILFALLVVAGAGFFSCWSEKTVMKLEAQVARMKEEIVPVRFEILEKKDGKIKVKVAVYDCGEEGKRVGSSQVFELDGEELNIDFQVVKFSDSNYLFFPVGLYTDRMALADSLKIFDLYNNEDFPAIYDSLVLANAADNSSLSTGSQQALQEELANLFAIVRNDKRSVSKEQYGMAVHDMKSISQFKKGFVYKVLCHPRTGGIEIVKE